MDRPPESPPELPPEPPPEPEPESGPAGADSLAATASRPPARRSSASSARFQAAEPTTLRLRGPRRWTTPRTSSSQEWKTVCAQCPVAVVEERAVDQPGAVVQGEEDDPAAGADRRGLGGRLRAGDQHGLAVPCVAQRLRGGHPQLPEELPAVVQQMAGGVHAEDAQFGVESLRVVHVGQPGRGDPRPDPPAGKRELALVRGSPVLPVQFGDLEQQVAAVRGAGTRPGPNRNPRSVQRAALTSRSATGRLGRARCQMSWSEAYGRRRDQPGGLVLADAVHVGEREPSTPIYRTPVRL